MRLNNLFSASVSTSMAAEVLSVCWSGAFRYVLTQCQGGKTSAMISGSNYCCPAIWEGLCGHQQTIWSLLFYSEKYYSHVGHIQDSGQSSQE